MDIRANSTKSKLVYALGGFLLGAIIGAGAVLAVYHSGYSKSAVSQVHDKDAEVVVGRFLTALTTMKFDEAYKCFATPLMEQQSREVFISSALKNARLYRPQSYELKSQRMGDVGARVFGKMSISNGAIVPVSFEIIRENGEYRIISYKIGKF